MQIKAVGSLLFSCVRGAESKLAHKQLSFVAVERLEFHAGGAALVVRLIADDEEIGATRLGSEMRGGGSTRGVNRHERLPTSAEVVFTGIDGNIEVGVGLSGADPIAVEAEASGGPWVADEIGIVLEEIDEGFSRVGLGEGMLGFFGFDVEFNVFSAAAGSSGGGSCGRSALGLDGSCES